MLTSSWRKDSFLESSACEEYVESGFQVMFDNAQWCFRLELSPAPDTPELQPTEPISTGDCGTQGPRLCGFHLVERLVGSV